MKEHTCSTTAAMMLQFLAEHAHAWKDELLRVAVSSEGRPKLEIECLVCEASSSAPLEMMTVEYPTVDGAVGYFAADGDDLPF